MSLPNALDDKTMEEKLSRKCHMARFNSESLLITLMHNPRMLPIFCLFIAFTFNMGK